MRYRAVLVDRDAKQERPVQILTNSRPSADEWAAMQLEKAASPDAAVLVYQTVEQQIAIIQKPKPETSK